MLEWRSMPPFTITVKNKDGIGMSCVKVYVSGSMAAPRGNADIIFIKILNAVGSM
jgi:hypothetical protein